MLKSFSYDEYQTIMQCYQNQHVIMDFAQVTDTTKRYCVIRHDVEFSIDRALNLARFEARVLNLQTTYLFQIRNNCYNIASDVNLEKIHEIQSLGHKVGLHVHLGLMDKQDNPTHFIQEEAKLFKWMTGIDVDRYSFHRPHGSILKDYLTVPGLINCYGRKFFHHYDTPHDDLNVKYFTDSRHDWQHGYPLESLPDRVQILTHPYSWTPQGHPNLENYRSLLKEKDAETRHSIQRETSTFPDVLLGD